jgi:hypothetical protein
MALPRPGVALFAIGIHHHQRNLAACDRYNKPKPINAPEKRRTLINGSRGSPHGWLAALVDRALAYDVVNRMRDATDCEPT